MRRQVLPAITIFLALTVLVGVVYPLVVTGVAQVAFGEKAEGSLATRDGKTVGSKLIGQNFEADKYFHPRPSAAGDGYDGSSSSGSNLGPSNPELQAAVDERIDAYRKLNAGSRVPQDAATASASGLDPDISPANARAQAARVAKARRVTVASVLSLIEEHERGRTFGFLGAPAVNVLELNIALDDTSRK